jgi:hypothetical protein
MPARWREGARQSPAKVPGETPRTLDGSLTLRYQGALVYHDHTEGTFMAVETSGGHPAMDYAEHVRTYQRFIRWTIGMIIFIVLILVFLATLVP